MNTQDTSAPPDATIGATAPPEVSVIVRSVGRDSLKATLDSVQAQTYRPIRLVVVLASGPDHPALPSTWGDLPVLQAAPLQGQRLRRPEAANLGLQTAPGPLLMFLDDDDLLLPDHLQRLVQALQAHPEWVAVNTGVEMGRFVDGVWQGEHRFDAPMDAVRLRFENHLPFHSVLFRAQTLQEGLRVDESFDLFEDWDFWLQLSRLGPWGHVPGTSARYVLSGHQQSEVFQETEAAGHARNRLFDKWRKLNTASEYEQVLARLQTLHRDAATTAGLRQILAARDADAAQWQQMQSGLQTLVAAREHEISEQAGAILNLQQLVSARNHEVHDLHAVLSAREQSLAEATRHTQYLKVLIQARDQELANTKLALDERSAMFTAREHELTQALAQLSATQATVSARDTEVRHLGLALTDLQTTLQAREQDIGQYAAQLTNLNALVKAREDELAAALAELQSLRAVLAAREEEIRQALSHASAQQMALQAKDADLARLRGDITRLNAELLELRATLDQRNDHLNMLLAESPLAALKRTLKKPAHGPSH